MDGPWQIGQLQAREYGRKARDAAQQMRVIDPNLQLIACGSSGTFMPTYLTWDREVLEECYDKVDGISLHAYYGNTAEWSGNSAARFLAMNLDMDRHIHEIAAVCDYVQGLQKSSKRLWLSFDEWNVWYRARGGQFTNGRRTAAPHLLEEVYNLEDALLVGGFVNTLLRNSDRVRVACLAQLVNVIAPLVTNESGVLRQSTYYPYSWALRYARGRVLDLRVESDTYQIKGTGLQADFARDADVPFLDLVATLDEPAGQAAVLMLNRDLDAARDIVLEWGDVVPDPGARLRDAHRPRSEGRQYVRGSAARRPAAARPAGGRRPDDLQPAAALVHRGAPGDSGMMRRIGNWRRARDSSRVASAFARSRYGATAFASAWLRPGLPSRSRPRAAKAGGPSGTSFATGCCVRAKRQRKEVLVREGLKVFQRRARRAVCNRNSPLPQPRDIVIAVVDGYRGVPTRDLMTLDGRLGHCSRGEARERTSIKVAFPHGVMRCVR